MNYSNFCCTKNAQEPLNQPFIAHGHLVASNGCIMIANPNTKDALEGTPLLQGEWPALMAFITVFISTAGTACFTPIDPSTIALHDKSVCSICQGNDLADTAHCGECDGNGGLDIDGDFHTYTVECKSCGGEGERHFTGTDPVNGPIDCDQCHGSGQTFDRDEFVVIKGVHIHPKYAELIFSLPDLHVSGDRSQNMLFFKSCEHIGVVMGTRV